MDQRNIALKVAVYTVSANVSVAIVGLALYYNYMLLEMYVTPLFWAVVVSVPAKQVHLKIVNRIKQGLEQNKDSEAQLLFSSFWWLLMLPKNVIVSSVSRLVDHILPTVEILRKFFFKTPSTSDDKTKKKKRIPQPDNKTNHSTRYLSMLFHVWVLFKFWELYDILGGTVITLLVVAIIVVCLAYAGLKRLFEHFELVEGFLKLWKKAMVLFSLAFRVFRNPFSQNLPSIVAVVLIASVLLGSAALFLYVAVHIMQETISVVDIVNDKMLNLVETKWNSGFLHDVGVASFAQKEMAKTIGYIQNRADEFFSGSRPWLEQVAGIVQNMGSSKGESSSVDWQRILELKSVDRARKTLTLYFTRGSGDLNTVYGVVKAASLEIWEQLQMKVAWNAFFALQSASTVILSLVFSALRYLFSTFVSFFVFTATLYYLLITEKSILDHVLVMFPAGMEETRKKLQLSVTGSVTSVLSTSVKICIFHAMFTWLVLSILQSPCVYMATVASAVTSVIPFIPNWLVSVPFAVFMILKGHTTWAVLLVLAHLLVYIFVDTDMYNEIDSSHPFIVGLSVVAGISVFNLQGALIGPLLVCVPVVAYNLFQEFRNSVKNVFLMTISEDRAVVTPVEPIVPSRPSSYPDTTTASTMRKRNTAATRGISPIRAAPREITAL